MLQAVRCDRLSRARAHACEEHRVPDRQAHGPRPVPRSPRGEAGRGISSIHVGPDTHGAARERSASSRMGQATRPSAADRRRREQCIVDIACRQYGVVTRAQLLALGLRDDGIDGRVAAGGLRRLHRGVYGIGPVLPPRAPLIAAVFACGPRAVLSHSSAGAVFEVTEPSPEARIDVTLPVPLDRRHAGIQLHRVARLADDERTERDGIPVTTPLRTLADLASVLTERDLERAIARAERAGLVRAADLDRLPDRYAGRRGSATLRAVLGRAHGPQLTRSEAEVRFLALIRRAKLPAPRANVALDGYEIDFLWPDHKLAVEVDGFRFHDSRASFERDRRRSADLASNGIQVIPLTWRQIVNEELATAVLLARALARRE